VIHRVRRHVDVERDILELAAWIARDSRDVAYRFFECVEDSMTSLRTMPGKGSLKHLRDRQLAKVRSWAVSGFPNHLILYEMRDRDVIVLAVVHGARSYKRLLLERLKPDSTDE
jgi:plasmid stabilization system protein ParE